MDSSSPALRLCCPAWCAVCRRHACCGAAAQSQAWPIRGVETHRGSIPPLRRCGSATQRAVPSAAAIRAAASAAQSQAWPIRGVETHRGSIPSLRRRGCAAQRGVASVVVETRGVFVRPCFGCCREAQRASAAAEATPFRPKGRQKPSAMSCGPAQPHAVSRR